MKKYLVPTLLILAGLINLVPVIGVISAERLEGLYGVPMDNSDLVILMRHRAVLFGLLGAFLLGAAFKVEWRLPACVGGLVSMLAFVVLAWQAGDYGEALHKVVVADLAASAGLLVALALDRWRR